MDFSTYFPVWNKLTPEQQNTISTSAVFRTIAQGTVITGDGTDCTGLLLLKSGQLRAYILSEEGREITIYRLFEWDICLFSASCILKSSQFEIMIEAEKDTELWVIPAEIYKALMEESLPVSNYTNEIMAARFSEVMWLIEQILWKSLDRRLAAFLLDEAVLEESSTLKITHEMIANHLGTAREVITRMLRYFQNEGIVKLRRGEIEIINTAGLRTISG